LGATADSDNFIVWNDEIYGDRDGDGLPEVPVSRIPDGLSPALVMAALGAGDASQSSRFGIRNIARPFADGLFTALPGSVKILISETTSPGTIGLGQAVGSHIYLMLHGSDFDSSQFWGETQDGDMFEALDTGNIPGNVRGVVLTGCCWGALTVAERASQIPPNRKPTPRPARSSIALSFLAAGAKAFVGCTGSHYSPVDPPYDYFGGPMHGSFWTGMGQGKAPAAALFDARLDYLKAMPHGQTSSYGIAIERKILKQFTCLGLGW
jgi:hypothetical protein